MNVTAPVAIVASLLTHDSITSGSYLLAIAAAIVAGLLSFLSPCVLPLVPSYVAFITGAGGAAAVSADDAPQDSTSAHTVRPFSLGLAFVSGFSAVFIMLGASASYIGGLFRTNGALISTLGGVMLILFGVMLLGVVRLPFADRDVRLLHRVTTNRRYGYPATFVVGAAFAAGWTPCIGPVLAGILTLAAATDTVWRGVILLSAYSVGLAIPFLLATVALDRFVLASARVRPHLGVINRIAGGLLIFLGLLMATGAMSRLSAWTAKFLPGWLS